MIIKDKNGEVVGSVELSKDEMAIINEPGFESFAKAYMDALVAMENRKKESEEIIHKRDKESEEIKHSRDKESEEIKHKRDKESEDLKLKLENELNESKYNRDKTFEENISMRKMKSEDIIRIVAAIVDSVKYGINEFTGLYEKYHQKPQQATTDVSSYNPDKAMI